MIRPQRRFGNWTEGSTCEPRVFCEPDATARDPLAGVRGAAYAAPGGALTDRCGVLGRCCTVPGPLGRREPSGAGRICAACGWTFCGGPDAAGRCAGCGALACTGRCGLVRGGIGAALTTGSARTFCVGARVGPWRAPQPPQNRESGSFWVPHVEQRIPSQRVTKPRVSRLNSTPYPMRRPKATRVVPSTSGA